MWAASLYVLMCYEGMKRLVSSRLTTQTSGQEQTQSASRFELLFPNIRFTGFQTKMGPAAFPNFLGLAALKLFIHVYARRICGVELTRIQIKP